jgi:hypothetical protein
MSPRKPPADKKAASRILGKETFAAITAVEGLSLSAEGKRRLSISKGLSSDQRRAEVIRAYVSDRKR